MAKDKRLYARFDIGFDEHDKIFPLSDQAFRALVEATLYSRRQLTDGFLAERLAIKRWGKDVLEELSTNDPEKPSLVKVDGGWMIHDYAEHQTTNADIQAKREAGAKGAASRWGNEPIAGAMAGAMRDPMQNDGTTLAKSESESETESYLLNTVSQVRNAREKSTDTKEAIESSKRLAEGIGVDLDQVIKAAKRIDRHLTHSEALRLATFILQKAKRDPENPNAYIAATFRDSWAEVQQWIDREAA